jgi:hypothetical protein
MASSNMFRPVIPENIPVGLTHLQAVPIIFLSLI